MGAITPILSTLRNVDPVTLNNGRLSQQQKYEMDRVTVAVDPQIDEEEFEKWKGERSCCTYAITGNELWFQAIYVCHTCQQHPKDERDGQHNNTDNQSTSGASSWCICESCAFSCHDGHDVEYVGVGPCYCDCPSQWDSNDGRCRLWDYSNKLVQSLMPATNQPFLLPSPPLLPPSLTSSTHTSCFPYHVTTMDIVPLLTTNSNPSLLRQLLIQECQTLIRHTKDTHWVSPSSYTNTHCDNTTMCQLEQLALFIMNHHMNSTIPQGIAEPLTNKYFNSIGAEWWVQVKPLNSSAKQDNDGHTQGINSLSSSIDLHYDKDETLAEVFGLGSFPTISTVTYLTSSHSKISSTNTPSPPQNPTIILPHCYHDAEDRNITQCILSYPYAGKHIAFDGRLLHGAPSHPALLPPQYEQHQRSNLKQPLNTLNYKPEEERITFLVNIWLQGPPIGVQPLTEHIRSLLLSSHNSETICHTNDTTQIKHFPSNLVLEYQIPSKFFIADEQNAQTFPKIEVQPCDINISSEQHLQDWERIQLPFLSKAGNTTTKLTVEENNEMVENSSRSSSSSYEEEEDELFLSIIPPIVQHWKDIPSSTTTFVITYGDGCEAHLQRTSLSYIDEE